MWNRYYPIDLPKIRVSFSFALIYFFFEKFTKLWFKNKNECMKNLKLFSEGSLKAVSATFLVVCFVCLTDSTCETRKNVFYFTTKALFVLEVIKFSLFRYSNIMTSSNVQTWNTKHILLNNVGSKHSLLMKFSQLMKLVPDSS